MSRAERSALWQRRLFEAEAGLTRYLTEQHGGRDLAGWIAVRGELFSGLPESDSEPAAWQRVFFRAQALMERFLISRYGHGELRAWAEANAQVHRYVEPDHGQGALDPVLRIARQAELYASEYRLLPSGRDRAAVEIAHCAIWDYRERARSRGVPLSLKSPCEYCTHATAANIAVKGYLPHHELLEGPDGHGCRWEAVATGEPASGSRPSGPGAAAPDPRSGRPPRAGRGPAPDPRGAEHAGRPAAEGDGVCAA
ncbi:hypothetical protein [Streptomyces sp. TS71-3]|uniref:hypothetical protein n=1 Tax=Streptomyces sp. TS71-3 TaxID=2733862 RepID=UPI001BB35849|nr:hypothetical protein [Streptomyces sp. TS71-3]